MPHTLAVAAEWGRERCYINMIDQVRISKQFTCQATGLIRNTYALADFIDSCGFRHKLSLV